MYRTTLSVLLLAFSAPAQDTLEFPIIIPSEPVQTFTPWQIGASFSPDIAYRNLSKGSSVGWITAARDKAESLLLSYTTGLNVVYNLNAALGIESSVQYSRKGYRSVYKHSGEPLKETRYLDTYDYIEIPVKLNYTIGRKKLRWTGSAGIVNGLLVDAHEKIRFKFNNGSESIANNDVTPDFRTYNLSVSLSAGIDWQLERRIHLKAEPTLRYGLTRIIDAPITAHLWNLGLNVGCYIGL